MGKTVNRQLQDGRGTNRYQVKKELTQFEGNVTPEKFLAEREIELKPRNEKQRKYIQEIHEKNHVIATGFAGCVDMDTEFLSQDGWKPISAYVVGDKVTQVSKEGLNASLVEPLDYVKRPCNWFYHFKTERGIDQMLSEDHHIAYTVKDKHKLNKVLVADMMGTLDDKPNGFLGKIPCTYNFNGKSLGLSEDQIRLGVAIKADAHLATESTGRFVFRLKKQRKIERLFKLLEVTKSEFKEYPNSNGYTVVSVYAPQHTKKLADWMFCSKEDASIIMSEYQYWDGDSTPKGNRLPRFCTSIKTEADALQYFANITNFRATVQEVNFDSFFTNEHSSYFYEGLVKYEVIVTKQTHISLTPKNRDTGLVTKPTVVQSKDGFKYCFEVPTGFLLLRRNGKVFVTGNTSKTFIPTMIASQMLRNKTIDRIILIRTPVSDEESVGMLKGTVEDKTKYWLMPILDTLNKALSPQLVDYLIKREQIICLPPEFLKGVSFSPRDFVIFDEVEDISKSVAIASVTRQGGGKLCMCGDLRQKMISRESGLPLLLDVVRQSPSLQNRVGLIEFDSFDDIVRSDDCKEWVKALCKHGYM